MFPDSHPASFYLRLWLVFVNGILILSVFLFLCFLHLPLLLNANIFLDGEQAQTINTVLDMVRGGAVYFYHEGYTYQGVLDSLLALPFFYALGVNALALKLSAVMLCSLYFWSCFILARLINREVAWIVLILILLPPVDNLTANYAYPTYWLVGFVGNIIFIFFCRVRISSGGSVNHFLLFFFIGLSVYVYTYSILYIATVLILYFLTYSGWEEIRSKILTSKLSQNFWSKWTSREKSIFLFDIVISGFFLGVLFSYVFGGFGIDFGGTTIFQINNLHKPLGQLLVLIILRLLIFGKDDGLILPVIRRINSIFDEKSSRLLVLGISGFIVGISPRIISILNQEVKRGGQGFDVDLSPTKILEHSWNILVDSIPKTLGFFQPLERMFFSFSSENFAIGFLAIMVILPLFFVAVWQFYYFNWETVKNIIVFREVRFNPSILLIIFPLLICLSNIITMNGPSQKYLFPLNFVFGVWVGLVLYRIKMKSGFLFVGILFIWIGFHSINIYQYYSELKMIKGLHVLVKQEPMVEVINFVLSKKIPVVYSSFGVGQKFSFLSWDRLDFRFCVSRFKNKMARDRQKSQCRWYIMGGNEIPIENPEQLMHSGDDFAVIISDVKGENALQKFMHFNKILFKRKNIGNYAVFWKFLGNTEKINQIPILTG